MFEVEKQHGSQSMRNGTCMEKMIANGKNTKDEKWTDIIHGMTIYTSEQIEKELENAGFSKIEVDQNQKDWLCLVCKKDD